MKKTTTCKNCLSQMIHNGEVKINFCFQCGSAMNLIPKDAHKDFISEPGLKKTHWLTNGSQDPIEKRIDEMIDMTEAMNKRSKEINKNVERFNHRNREVFDWEKTDWYQELKKLKF